MIYLNYEIVAQDYDIYPDNEQPPKPLRLTAEDTGTPSTNIVALLKPLFAIQSGAGFDVELKPYWHAFFGTYNAETNAFLGFDTARAGVIQNVLDEKIKKDSAHLITQQRERNSYTDAGSVIFKKDNEQSADGTNYFDVLATFCAQQKSELEGLGFSLCQVSDSEIVFKAAAMLITRPAIALGNYIDFN